MVGVKSQHLTSVWPKTVRVHAAVRGQRAQPGSDVETFATRNQRPARFS